MTRLLVLCLTLCFCNITFAEKLLGEFLINGQVQSSVLANSPYLFEFKFYDSKDVAMAVEVKDFVPMHGRIAHVIVVKRGLQKLVHVHPTYDSHHGLFSLPLNLATANPDNTMAETALNTPGMYDVIIEAKSQKHGMQMARFPLEVRGNDLTQPIAPDTKHNGVYTKYFTEDMQQGKEGDLHRSTLRVERIPGQGGELINFYINFKVKNSDNKYVVPKNLEPWLMMGAHAIIAKVKDDSFYVPLIHTHSMLPIEGESQYTFSYFNRGAFSGGLFRAWVQLKHDGVIKTLVHSFKL